jgi:hypothetical protein
VKKLPLFGEKKERPKSEAEYESILASAAALEAKGDCAAALNEYERAIRRDCHRSEGYLEAAKMLLRHDGIWDGNIPANSLELNMR